MTRSQEKLRFVGPLYEQVADELRKMIATGEFDRQHQLPAEVELANTFGVSSGTMRKALEQLVNSGLIRRQRGRGTVLNRRPSRHSRIQHFIDFSKVGLGIRPIVFTPSASVIRPLSSKEAEELELDSNCTVLATQGSWNGPEGSRAIETILSPQGQASNELRQLQNVDPSESRQHRNASEPLVVSETTLKPEIATDTLADEIGIESGRPVLCFKSLTRGTKKTLVEYVRVWIHLNEAEYAWRTCGCSETQLKTY